MPGGAQDDGQVQHGRPVFEIEHIGLEAMGDGFDGAGFAAEAADLGQARDAGLDEGADVEGGHDVRKMVVVFDQVGARADNAHLAAKHVDELGEFIQGIPAQDAAGGKEAGAIGIGRGISGGRRMHGPEFPDGKFAVLDACADLLEEEWAGRLEPVQEPDDKGEGRQDDGNNDQGEGDIEGAFHCPVEGALERFLMQRKEVEAVIFENGNGMPKALLEIAEDEETGAGMLDGFDKRRGVFAQIHQEHLRDVVACDDACQETRRAENGAPGGIEMSVVLIAQDSHGAKAETGLAPQPGGQMGESEAGADEQGFLLPHFAEGYPEEEVGEPVIGGEEAEIKRSDEGKQEKAGDVAGVFGHEQEEEERAHRRHGLAQNGGEMLQKGALVKGLAGAAQVRGEKADDEYEAVAVVAGQVQRAIRRQNPGKHAEPGPEQDDSHGGLEGDEEGFNAADALGNHGNCGMRSADCGMAGASAG